MKKVALIGFSLVTLGMITGCSQPKATETKGSTKESVAAVIDTSSDDKGTSKQTESSGSLTVTEAIDIFKKAYPDADVTGVELGQSFGKDVIQVEGQDDTNEYEMTIDMVSKEVTKDKKDKLDRDDQNEQERKEKALDVTDLLSVEEISEIAQKEVGNGEAVEWDLSKELGTTYWEVKIKESQMKETSVKINAQTGDILEVDKD